jgi:hypothetical protein
MRQQPIPHRSTWSASRLLPLAGAWALLAWGNATAQSDLAWGIEERAARGCVQAAALEFHAVGSLGGHAPQPLCGSTAVRMYPEPLPTGLLTISFRNDKGEPRRYEIPLDAVFRRESVRMAQSVLEIVYGQDSVEMWVRPLPASAGGEPVAAYQSDRTSMPKRIYFGGLELDARPPRPGISRSPAQ